MSLPFQTYTIAQQILLACLPVAPDHEHLAALLSMNPDWDELHNQGSRHGVLPLIYQALKKYPDPLFPADELDRFRRWFAAHTLRCLQMQKELRLLVDLLTDQHIPVIPYKGVVLAEEAYGDVALRSFNDLDLLVPREQAWSAVQSLLAQGYWLDFSLTEVLLEGFQKSNNHLYLHHHQYDWGVEIHWEVFHPIDVIPFDLSAHWLNLKGGREGRLEHEETLLMLCAHGTKHFWSQLKWLVDIDRLIRQETGLVWEQALLQAGRSGSVRALLLGLDLSRDFFATPCPGQVAEQIKSDHVVRLLKEDVAVNLFPADPERRRFLRECNFYFRSRENAKDRLLQVYRWLLSPRPSDWQAFPLGARYPWLYSIERPIRMAWKHLFKRIFN